jgi:hypothetical protein
MGKSLRGMLGALLVWLAAAGGAAAQTVVVNEVMTSNTSTIADADGAYSDWIELYNTGATTIDLTGCYVSDDPALPLKWMFPQGTIPAHGFLLVWASDKNMVTAGGQLHTNFKLSSTGEPVLLTAANGVTPLDQAPATVVLSNQSYGRQPDGGAVWATYPTATPGAANGAVQTVVATPTFSMPAGFYAGSFILNLAVTDPTATIRYTLDGSEPTATSTPYTGSITVNDPTSNPAVHALIPTNFYPTSHWSWRLPRGTIDKIAVVRARAFHDGQAPSAIATRSFIVGPTVASHCTFPVVSLVTDPQNLFNFNTGIYVPGVNYVPGNNATGNYFQSGVAWERPVHIELFNATGGLEISQNAGVRISGSATNVLPQKGLKLYADAAYGPSTFATQLFPDLPYNSWARFRLRASGDDWGYLGFRDLCIEDMSSGLGFDTQVGRPVIHFMDGEYWGLANLRDEYSRYYYERVYGVPATEVVVLENNAEIDDGPLDGNVSFLNLRTYIANHNMATAAYYAHADSLMDISNFINYHTAQIYAANTDWPGNNIVFWRRNTAGYVADAPYGQDGKWRWSMKDMDDSFHDATYDAMAAATAVGGPTWPNPDWSTVMLRGLLANPGFKQTFINTIADQLNSSFRSTAMIPVIDGYAAQYQPAIARWYDRYDLTEDWAQRVQWLREFTQNRPAYLRQHVVTKFALAGTSDITLNVSSAAAGAVRINNLVVDAGTPGLPVAGQPYPWTGTYFRGNAVTVTALPNPGYTFVRWQETGATTPTLTITPGAAAVTRTAVFAAEANPPHLAHYWNFNLLPAGALTSVAADLAAVGTPTITYPGTGIGYMDNVAGDLLNAQNGATAGLGLRVRNPSDTRELRITLPTTGLAEPSLAMAGWRSASGPQSFHLEYATSAVTDNWVTLGPVHTLTEIPEVFTWDFAAITAASRNPAFRVRLLFSVNTTAASGNSRWDNIVMYGRTSWVSDVPDGGGTLPARKMNLSVAPNPFNPQTTLSFELASPGRATLQIFDLAGRHVRTLVSAELPSGRHELKWDGADGNGRAVASGAYVARVSADQGTAMVKVQLLR